MTMTHTFTRTHVFVEFADPYLKCGQCQERAVGYHEPAQCGCHDGTWTVPCGHKSAEVTSTCPSWGPVDGCTCEVPHG